MLWRLFANPKTERALIKFAKRRQSGDLFLEPHSSGEAQNKLSQQMRITADIDDGEEIPHISLVDVEPQLEPDTKTLASHEQKGHHH